MPLRGPHVLVVGVVIGIAGCDGKAASAGGRDTRGRENPLTEKAMDPTGRRVQLRAARDWEGLTEELQREIASTTDAGYKASLHIELGRVLEEKLLRVVPALKHFQDAYKLEPTHVEALRRSRGVYWSLGKVNMVQKLLELELVHAEGHPGAGDLLVELGDVSCDLGEWEKASAAYERALSVSAGLSREAREAEGDLKLDKTTFRARIDQLQREAAAADAGGRGRRFMRAARIAKRFSPAEVEGLLASAYSADPRSNAAVVAYEELLIERHRDQTIFETQRRILDGLSGVARGEMAFRYGARWAVRYQDAEAAVPFFEEALQHDPSIDAASVFLREHRSKKPGK